MERERINEHRHSGVFMGWQKSKAGDKFGWIQLVNNIKHPAAEKNKGKIFVTENDLESVTSEDIKKGTNVNFVAYVDSKGLGAEEVKKSKNQNNPLQPTQPKTTKVKAPAVLG